METASTVCRRAGEGPRHMIVGMVHEYRLLARESGQFMSFIANVPPGCGAPMHHHDRDSESIYIEGSVTARAVATQSPGLEAEKFFAEIGSRNGVRIAQVPEYI